MILAVAGMGLSGIQDGGSVNTLFTDSEAWLVRSFSDHFAFAPRWEFTIVQHTLHLVGIEIPCGERWQIL